MSFLTSLVRNVFAGSRRSSLSKRRPERILRATAVEVLEPRIVLAANFWLAAESGDWNDDANWSDGTPTSDDDVFINAIGSVYTVTLGGRVDVASLTIASNEATLSLEGAPNVFGGIDSPLLDVDTQLINGGTIVVGADADLGGTIRVEGQFQNQGEFRSEPGTRTLRLQADVLNTGSILLAGATNLIRDNGGLENRGTFEVAAGATLQTIGQPVEIIQADGVLNLAGNVVFDDVLFAFQGGTINGAVPLEDATLRLESSNAAEFVLKGTTELEGDISPNQTLSAVGRTDIFGNVISPRINHTGDLENLGSLSFTGNESPNGGVIDLRGGTFTNTGSLHFPTGSLRNTHRILGSFNNTGTAVFESNVFIDGNTLTQNNSGTIIINGSQVEYDLFLSNSARSLTNTGQIQLDSNAKLKLTRGTFNQEASGEITGAGTVEFLFGTLNFNDPDPLNTNVVFTGTSGGLNTLNLNANGSAEFTLDETSAELSGNIAQGQTIRMINSRLFSVDPTFANSGTILLDDAPDSNRLTELGTRTGGILTNTLTGTIEVTAGDSLAEINPPLFNDGTVRVSRETRFLNGAANTNRNTFVVETDGRVFFPLANRAFTQESGVLDIQGAFELTDDDFQFSGGQILGTPKLFDSRLSLNTPIVAEFDLRGTTDLLTDVAASHTLNFDHEGITTGNGLRSATGFTNHGTINVGGSETRAGFFHILSGSLVNGETGTINFLDDTPVEHRIDGHVVNQGELNIDQGLRIFKANTTHRNAGTIRVNDTALLVNQGDFLNEESGVFAGNGTYEFSGSTELQQQGEIAPGFSPGALTITTSADAITSETTTYRIELGGTIPGTGFDQIQFSGDVVLSGSLEVSILEGFVPELGTRFEIMTAPAFLGSFSSVLLPDFLQLDLSDPTKVVLEVVEPIHDLAVETISVPSASVINEPFTVEYTVTNNGAATTQGGWRDSVFLSLDETFDPAEDLLLGRVDHVGDLDRGASYTETLTTLPPFILPGKYFVIVVADSLREIPDSDVANNVGVSTETICLEFETLPFDERQVKVLPPGGRVRIQVPPFRNGDGNGNGNGNGDDENEGEQKFFKLRIENLRFGSRVRVSTNPDGKNDQGFLITPDPSDTTLRSVTLTANQTYYVSIESDPNDVDDVNFDIIAECIKADVEKIELIRFTPEETTIQVTGFGLALDMEYCLEDPGSGEVFCGAVEVLNSRKVQVTFSNLRPLIYNFQCDDPQGERIFECDSCLDTTNVTPATFDISVDAQSPVGVGRNSPITLRIQNNGSVPTESRLIFVDGDNGSLVNGSDGPFPILVPQIPSGGQVTQTVDFLGTTGGTVNVQVSQADTSASTSNLFSELAGFVSKNEVGGFFQGLFPERENLLGNNSAEPDQIVINTFNALFGATLIFDGNPTDGFTLVNVSPPGLNVPPLLPDGNGNFVLDFSSFGVPVQFLYDANGREVGIIVDGKVGEPVFLENFGAFRLEGFLFDEDVKFNELFFEFGLYTTPTIVIAQITENIVEGPGATLATLTTALTEVQDHLDSLNTTDSPSVQNTNRRSFSSQNVLDLLRFVAKDAGGFGQIESQHTTGALGKGVSDITKFSAKPFNSKFQKGEIGSKIRVEVEIFGQKHVFEGTLANTDGDLQDVRNLDPNSDVVPGNGFNAVAPSFFIGEGSSPGSSLSVEFDSSGRLQSIVDSSSLTQDNPGETRLNARYDAQGRLVGFDRTDLDGEFNVVNQQDNFIEFQYNADGNLEKVVALDGGMIAFDYDGEMLSQITTADGTTSFQFNPDCTLAQVTHPDGSVLKFFYTTTKFLQSVTDGNNQTLSEFDYSQLGKVVVETPDGKFTVLRDENGQAEKIENEDGTTTTDPEEIRDKAQQTPGGSSVFQQNGLSSPINQAVSNALSNLTQLLNPNNSAATISSDGLFDGLTNAALQRLLAAIPTISLTDFTFALLASLDPNEIVGPEGFGPEGFIVKDRILPYTIHFENDPEATAPAQEVFVTQQLDADLDLGTFEFGSFGFGGQVFDVPAGQQQFQTQLDLTAAFGILLNVEGSLNPTTRIVEWAFRSIDPATGDLPSNPLFGFLPPNLTSPEGQGFVNYRVRTLESVGSGTRIDAEARIVFDVNDPIDTPAILNTIDDGVPSSQINPLPAFVDSSDFVVSWSGADDSGGSGIGTFDVFVSENGSEFTLLLDDTSATSTIFSGTDGSSYAFFSVATDNVGFEESPPVVADASTTIQLNQPPVAVDDLFTIAEDTPLAGTVAANDFDPNDDALQFTQTSNVRNGVLVFSSDGTFTYTPNENFHGSDSFDYTVNDGKGESATATVNITITPVNDVPTTGDDTATTAEDTAITVNVLSNDEDADGDTLTVTVTSDPQDGTAFVNLDGTITYTPNENFFGNDSLVYSVDDGNGGSTTATLEITVTPVNDNPVASNDNATTTQDTSVTINVLENDADGDGDDLTVAITSTPQNGTAQVNLDGTITYTPHFGFVGNDSLVYSVNDGNGGTATATLNITITPAVSTPGISLDNGVLRIVGTSNNDWIHVFRVFNRIVVINNFLDERFTTFRSHEIDEITIYAGAGDDVALLGSHGLPNAKIDGGDGNDLLIGSSGDDLIRGGAGNDILFGHKGDDILLGGDGSDIILGGKGDDILIGNGGSDWLKGGRGRDLFITESTSFDQDDDLLEELREQWTERRSTAERVQSISELGLTIHDDNIGDQIHDVFSNDLFLSDILNQ